jgi:hypothetical protein
LIFNSGNVSCIVAIEKIIVQTSDAGILGKKATLINVQGQVIRTIILSNTSVIQVSDLQKGIYFLITANKQSYKISKQ